MPEQLPTPPQQLSHAQNLREQALRRLSRSPHPYHRQQFELPHSSERVGNDSPYRASPLRSANNSEDEGQQGRSLGKDEGYRESTNSDSGTEADDEHFLKGLPAPKLRPHKGLRGVDGNSSSTPSPLLSPDILDEDNLKSPGYLRRSTLPSILLTEDEARKAAEKFRQKRRIEVVRRITEAVLLIVVGVFLCLDRGVRGVIQFWRKELASQFFITQALIVLYPLRLLRHVKRSKKWERPFPIALPAVFDPAPLFYPPLLTLFVSAVISSENVLNFLPSIILGIASLPRHLIPSTGGLEGSNICHWLISCLPLWFARSNDQFVKFSQVQHAQIKSEVLVVLPALHQALCGTLHYLTTTSLLEAELQLLSIALIHLLLLAASPQAVILKAVLWGGGVGVLLSCGHVLTWGVALARVPKWRFKRTAAAKSQIGRGVIQAQRTFALGKLGSILAKDPDVGSSDDDEGVKSDEPLRKSRSLKLNTWNVTSRAGGNGSVSAIEPQHSGHFMNGNASKDHNMLTNSQRRNTLPSVIQALPKLSKMTPSGRKRRTMSSGAQSFFSLTQAEATVRKWMYAVYVYVCIILIILVGIRDYVARYAIGGEEPIGWALGYLFGNIPRFRMEVVSANLQRWICLPARSGLEYEESCYLGRVEHLRHASFGEANTRLILCAYWLGIIIVGLAVVFRLSAIYEVDTRRKVFHFMMVAMLLPATYVDPAFAALALSLMLAIFLMLDLFRASQLPPLSKQLAYFLTPYVDGRDLKGPVVISHIFLLIGCAIPLWLSLGSLPRTGTGCLKGWEVPTREVSMVSGVICVGMGDAAASLIGRRYGRRKWLWGGGKSIEGSVAFATAVALALVLAKAWLRIGGWPANNTDRWALTGLKASIAACMASLTEAVLTGGNDNVVVPVVLWLCVKGLDI